MSLNWDQISTSYRVKVYFNPMGHDHDALIFPLLTEDTNKIETSVDAVSTHLRVFSCLLLESGFRLLVFAIIGVRFKNMQCSNYWSQSSNYSFLQLLESGFSF